MDRERDWDFETRAIHAGQRPDPTTGAVVTPVYLTSTYAQDAVGEHRGYEYSRSGNPTRTALEDCLTDLEGARHGFAFASGLAGEDAVLRTLAPGDHVVLGNDVYGGTYRMVTRVFGPAGVPCTTADLTDLSALAAAWRDETRMVWVESPTNPLLGIVDIAAVAAFAHERGARCVVDNTFATPYLQRPLELGADVVVHSTTKYLGGHSDVVGGFVATDDDELAERIGFFQFAIGAVPGPLDCFLVLRGVKTLPVRMDRACANARVVAEALAAHPAVEQVLWPGLPTHPGHDVAVKQMSDFGAMVSFTTKGGEEAAVAAAGGTRVFTLAESLGAVESLIEHPGRMTHLSTAGSSIEVPA
ncbi:MAG TPA: cystathionine gamma-synthase, partial [Acidimicrobiales bacterium]